MSSTVVQCILYLAVLVLLAIPLGAYIGKIMNGEKVILSKVVVPVENMTYRILKVDKDEQMTAKKYGISAILFSLFSIIVLFLLHFLQGFLPLNPQSMSGTS